MGVVLPEATLTAVGRLTVAVTDLEQLLAWIGDASSLVREPGAALTAARRAVQEAPPDARDYLVGAVEAAATQLAIAQALRHSLSTSPPDALVINETAARILRCREWLHRTVEGHLATSS
jgi:hypothetical protein